MAQSLKVRFARDTSLFTHLTNHRLQEEIETWSEALKAYDAQDWDASLDHFSVRPKLATSSRRSFVSPASFSENLRQLQDPHQHWSHLRISRRARTCCKLILSLLFTSLDCDPPNAPPSSLLQIENFVAAVDLDNYLAIAYFQAGVSHFLIGQFEPALQNFDEAFQFMRGNEAINYEQLGLKYQLYTCSILFNQCVFLTF